MTNSETMTRRGARVIYVPPPLYYAAGFGLGMLLEHVTAVPIGARPATTVAGAVIGAAGLSLTFAAAAAVIRHRTTIVPHRPVATLLTSGPFRLSRNPMYTGLAIAYLGGALLAGSWWPILISPAVIAAIVFLVIKPEEEYLAQRFGRSYADYREQVGRWL